MSARFGGSRPGRAFVSGTILLFFSVSFAHAWGWEAHRMINRAAVGVLPPEMRVQVERFTDLLAAHAPDPDLWKDRPGERQGHYIDLELGDRNGPPFAELPRDYASALEKLGPDSLLKMGTLPWRIASYFGKFVSSLRSPDDSTLVMMAALGHYVADADMPLHTTVNYDGQFTGNRGIHFRFEWWMIEQNRDKVVLYPQLPAWVYDPLDAAWSIILRSHAAIDTLLRADTAVRRTFRVPHMDEHGRGVADPQYDQHLWQRLGGIACGRMSLAAEAVAGYWYAAWLEAGKPDMSRLPAPPPPPPTD